LGEKGLVPRRPGRNIPLALDNQRLLLVTESGKENTGKLTTETRNTDFPCLGETADKSCCRAARTPLRGTSLP